MFKVSLAFLMIFLVPIFAVPSDIDFSSISNREINSWADFHKFEAKIKAAKFERAQELFKLEPPSRYNQTEYDVLYYNLSMEIDLENEYVDSASNRVVGRSLIDGLSTLELNFTDSIIDPVWYPDSIYLVVDSVYTETGLLAFAHENNKITIELDRIYNLNEIFSFMVRYHGHPFSRYTYIFETVKSHGDGLAFGVQNALFDEGSTIKVAYTDCEPYESRKWWPCKDTPGDKPDSMGIHITVRDPYYCASNGKLVGIDQVQGTPSRRTFHYKVTHPIVTYAVSLAISEYIIWTDWYHYGVNDSMPIVNHIYPYFYEEALETWDITPGALEIYADAFGEYPFVNEKYGHSQYENYGMEHQTCTAMPSNPWAHTTEYLIIHEMAHQWWGDMITCKTWHDIWLNEGFATYSEAIYYEGLGGQAAYREHMRSLEYYDLRSVYIYDTTYPGNVFNIVVYHKGAWVLHMLRGYIGDEMFFNLLKAYYNEYMYRNLTTEEFITFCNNFCGQNLDEFFNDWVYDIMYPVYARSYLTEQDLSDGQYWTYFCLLQSQTYGPDVFEMPVDIRLYNGSEILMDTIVFNNSAEQMFIFKTSEVPDSIAVDPDNWILNDGFKFPWDYHLIPLPLDTADQYDWYLDTIICRGGSNENQFQIISGNLPDGLILDAGKGIISGAPEETGEFAFIIRSDDTHSSYFDELEFHLMVRENLLGRPGDANNDGKLDILDIVYLINFKYKSGPPPESPVLADANNDCKIDILDIVLLINHLYKDGIGPQIGCAG